jgi:isoleucyl-tRNA synthetase
LQSELDIYAGDATYATLSALGDDLRFVLITSRATVHYRAGAVEIQVAPSAHVKCDRCWHYRADVGADAEHPHICGRCVSNLFGSGEVRSHA